MAKPFLRWVGGKARIASLLTRLLPELKDGSCYYEPFLGAGSVFLQYRPPKACLSDANTHLVETYKHVKQSPAVVSRYVSRLVREDSPEAYAKARELFNFSIAGPAQAARFIYLNHTCFNGIYRVSKSGRFNVPHGRRSRIATPSRSNLLEIAKHLQNARVRVADYRAATGNAKAGDVIYFDPPYPPLNGTSFFTHYTKDRFSPEDQLELAKIANSLVRKGCFVLMTNAEVPQVKKLYADWLGSRVLRTRWVTCHNKKHKVREVILAGFLRQEWPGEHARLKEILPDLDRISRLR